MKEVSKKDSTAIHITDTQTGVIKTIKLVTEKQLAYIRQLEQLAGVKPKKYTNLTVWQAVKVIKRLKVKNNQSRLV